MTGTVCGLPTLPTAAQHTTNCSGPVVTKQCLVPHVSLHSDFFFNHQYIHMHHVKQERKRKVDFKYHIFKTIAKHYSCAKAIQYDISTSPDKAIHSTPNSQESNDHKI